MQLSDRVQDISFDILHAYKRSETIMPVLQLKFRLFVKWYTRGEYNDEWQ